MDNDSIDDLAPRRRPSRINKAVTRVDQLPSAVRSSRLAERTRGNYENETARLSESQSRAYLNADPLTHSVKASRSAREIAEREIDASRAMPVSEGKKQEERAGVSVNFELILSDERDTQLAFIEFSRRVDYFDAVERKSTCLSAEDVNDAINSLSGIDDPSERKEFYQSEQINVDIEKNNDAYIASAVISPNKAPDVAADGSITGSTQRVESVVNVEFIYVDKSGGVVSRRSKAVTFSGLRRANGDTTWDVPSQDVTAPSVDVPSLVNAHKNETVTVSHDDDSVTHEVRVVDADRSRSESRKARVSAVTSIGGIDFSADLGEHVIERVISVDDDGNEQTVKSEEASVVDVITRLSNKELYVESVNADEYDVTARVKPLGASNHALSDQDDDALFSDYRAGYVRVPSKFEQSDVLAFRRVSERIAVEVVDPINAIRSVDEATPLSIADMSGDAWSRFAEVSAACSEKRRLPSDSDLFFMTKSLSARKIGAMMKTVTVDSSASAADVAEYVSRHVMVRSSHGSTSSLLDERADRIVTAVSVCSVSESGDSVKLAILCVSLARRE